MPILDAFFVIAIIIFSAVIHEVMHGVAAEWLGDPTARLQGRITLNPFKHIDLFGSVLLPAILVYTQSPFLFGWAKPVPYNPYNLRPGRFSEAIVAAAGPVANLIIAVLFGLLIRFFDFFSGFDPMLFYIVFINVMLFLFNLIPIPPLDGSKVLEALLPRSLQYGYTRWRTNMEHNPFLGMMIVILIIVFLGGSFGRFIYQVAQAIAGL